MKKRALMALPNLTATDEMKKIATSDLPRKEKTDYGYVREVCEYYTYLRCIKQDGILKVAFFFPEHLRLDGSNPAYEVYLDKEKRQFITYNSLIQKWCESKLDRLDWKRQYWYTKAYWISEEDETSIQTYLNIDKKAVEAILQFQRDVRDEQLEQRHRRETDPWDKDMEQVPELPKDWSRWVDKVAIRQNYIYYHYKKGGAKTGYCTYCEKEVPIKVHPHHNQKGRCSCCRHSVVFKAYGRAGYMQTEKHFAYLIQRCKVGFVVREFQADRTYRKESLPNSRLYCQEIRRTIYDKERKPRTSIGGCISSAICVGFPDPPVLTTGLVRIMDGSMAKRCQLWNRRNFDAQGWSTGFGSRKALIRKNIWLCSNGYRKWNRSARRACRSLPENVSVPAERSVNLSKTVVQGA